MSKHQLTEKQKSTYRVFPTTSETRNKEALVKYLNKEVEKIEKEINRIGRTRGENLTAKDSELWVTGRFRKQWLLAQLDTLVQTNEFPIGMKQASSKEALNHLFNKNK